MGNINISQLAGYTRITLTQDGKLGIGVLTPKSTLHVANEIRLGENSDNRVTLISDNYKANGTEGKIDLYVKTENATVSSGDIVLESGTATTRGAIILKDKVKMLNPTVSYIRGTYNLMQLAGTSGGGNIFEINSNSQPTGVGSSPIPEVDYDRVLHFVIMESNADVEVPSALAEIAVENSIGSNNYVSAARGKVGSYSTYNALVPAGCKAKCSINVNMPATILRTRVYIYTRRFGV